MSYVSKIKPPDYDPNMSFGEMVRGVSDGARQRPESEANAHRRAKAAILQSTNQLIAAIDAALARIMRKRESNSSRSLAALDNRCGALRLQAMSLYTALSEGDLTQCLNTIHAEKALLHDELEHYAHEEKQHAHTDDDAPAITATSDLIIQSVKDVESSIESMFRPGRKVYTRRT